MTVKNEQIASEMQKKVAAMSFEEALKELENVVRKLETGNEQLDSAVADYEYGTVLRAHCEKKLHDATLRIEKIVKNADGTLALKEGEI